MNIKAIKTENIIFFTAAAVLVFFAGNRIGYLYHTNVDADLFARLGYVSDNLTSLKTYLGFSLRTNDFLFGAVFAGCFGLFVLYISTSRKNYRCGEEHGSAKWGTPSDIAPMIDPKYENNMLFTQTERMSLNIRETLRNNNVIVVGGSGSGKTRFCVKPNIMQMHSSYIITDPKGSLLGECGKMLADNGYVIKTINLIDFNSSMKYNPFHYIRSEKDILKLVDIIIKSCGDKNEKQDFWVKAERLLFQALIGYIFYEMPPHRQNFATLLQLLNMMEVREDDEAFENTVDGIFKLLSQKNPEHYAVLQYKKYKMAAGKTAKSILISCGVRLAAFDIKEVRELTMTDEMEIESIGKRKTAVFIVTDDTSETFNFLAAMFYTQLFNTLCNLADTKYKSKGSRLPIHVRCILDEFANIGQIPDFEKLIATIRSREISATIIVQNLAQIEALYNKQAGTVVGNCDSFLFLGSGEDKTADTISKKVGKSTIDHKNTSTSKGSQGSFTISDQVMGRELLTPDEVGRLKNSECILFIRGLPPFKSKKFDIEKHTNYKYLSDANDDNYFDIIKYNERLKAEMDSVDSLFDENLTEENFIEI